MRKWSLNRGNQRAERHFGIYSLNVIFTPQLYSADPRFGLEDFTDSDHLAVRGAEKFSLILKDEIVSRYVR